MMAVRVTMLRPCALPLLASATLPHHPGSNNGCLFASSPPVRNLAFARSVQNCDTPITSPVESIDELCSPPSQHTSPHDPCLQWQCQLKMVLSSVPHPHLPTWYKKYWQWSSDSGWGERMIWCRSVSISSYTTYTS